MTGLAELSDTSRAKHQNQPRIMVIEDEKDINDLITIHLTQQGYDVISLSSGEEAIERIQDSANFDLFLIDRMLGKVSGLDLCRFIRMYQKTRHLPVMMVTVLSNAEQTIEGLDAGADDYLAKPFDIDILSARIRALLRRPQPAITDIDEPDLLMVNEIKISKSQCRTWVGQLEINLTISEFKILFTLMEQTGKVLSREQLVHCMQQDPSEVTMRTIDNHISCIRKKLGSSGFLIETIRGVGYRISAH